LLKLANEIPRIFLGAPEVEIQTDLRNLKSETSGTDAPRSTVDLQPELRVSSARTWTSLDLVVTVKAVKLHLYDASAYSESQLKEHGIARFALNDNTLRLKVLSDGAAEAQVVLRSFTMGNTRPGPNKFREIIPAAQHDRNQFMLLYTMSGGQNSSSLAVLTVDSPRIIFAIDPVISLLEFFTSAFAGPSSQSVSSQVPEVQEEEPQSKGTMDFRFDLHDVSISVLENDADAESRAIRLYINQILLSQQVSKASRHISSINNICQGILALNVNHLGMSLMRMGRASESVRFLDDVDLTVSLDSRATASQQMTNIEIAAKPIVFRASYRDINLITSIVNKAIEKYGESQQRIKQQADSQLATTTSPDREVIATVTTSSSKSRSQSIGKARVLMTKEQASCRTWPHLFAVLMIPKLKASFDGFRLVLIGDLHEQPMLHLKIKPFIVGAKDWSGEVLSLC